MSYDQIVAEVEDQIRKAYLLECDMRDLGLRDLEGNLVQPATAKEIGILEKADPICLCDLCSRQAGHGWFKGSTSPSGFCWFCHLAGRHGGGACQARHGPVP